MTTSNYPGHILSIDFHISYEIVVIDLLATLVALSYFHIVDIYKTLTIEQHLLDHTILNVTPFASHPFNPPTSLTTTELL
jgi:hypothetical protein